jgi:sulfide:quinone oxidoreductase
MKWITNARVTSVEAGTMHVEEVGEDGSVKDDPCPALRLLHDAARLPGVSAIRGVETSSIRAASS